MHIAIFLKFGIICGWWTRIIITTWSGLTKGVPRAHTYTVGRSVTVVKVLTREKLTYCLNLFLTVDFLNFPS